MSEHTASPWESSADRATSQYWLYGADSHGVPHAVTLNTPPHTAAADARLIAAAPDLLAACESVEALLAQVESGFHVVRADGHLPRLRAAIAKAKGEPDVV
jgi:hypothetical protein